MAGPTTAVISAQLAAMEARLNRSEQERAIEYRELRAANAAHEQSDKEEFADVRHSTTEIKDSINELKLMIAEGLSGSDEVALLKKDVESLKITRAGTKPWIDMLIKMIWALLGAGIAWLLSHGGLGSQ